MPKRVVESVLCAVVFSSSVALAQPDPPPSPEAAADAPSKPEAPSAPPSERSEVRPAEPAATTGSRGEPEPPRESLPSASTVVRRFGIGTSGGGGFAGLTLIGNPYGGPVPSLLGLVPTFPSLDARFFLATGRSLDFSFHLGRFLAVLAQGRGLLLGLEAHYNFNLPAGRNLRLLLAPGLSASGGYSSDLGVVGTTSLTGAYNPNYGYPGYTYRPLLLGVGALAIGADIGAEVLTDDAWVGVSFVARPSVGFIIAGAPANSVTGSGAAVLGVFQGGIVGLVGLTFYATRKE